MLLRHLRYFTVLAREKHFARAARACNISQPTLSGALATLERELRVRLIVRGRQFVGLTAEGQLVLEGAHGLLATEDAMRQGLEALRGGLTGVLRLGVIPAAMPAVGPLTEPFCAAHPSVTVEVRSLSSKSIEAGLHSFELDAGITYLENEPLTEVRRLPLYLERYLLATPARSAHADRAQIGWREASAQRLCLLSQDMQNRRILDAVFRQLDVEARPYVSTNSFLAILSHLQTGMWSSIVPHTFRRLFGEHNDIALIPLIEPLHMQAIGLVTSDRNPPAPIARALEACVGGLDLEGAFDVPAQVL
jgi:DNA-binding transcriptional LysR family regulator